MNQALQLFKQYHNSPQGGHEGKVKTRIALTSRYYWPGMTKDIAGWVERCLHCQKAGKELNQDTTLKTIKVSKPWDLVGMHFIGPLPATKEGYQYILTATDYVTRWVEAFPLHTKSAYEVVKKIYKIIMEFGGVRRILTDRSPEFNNVFNLEMCKKWGIERIFTSPGHPLTNGFAHSTTKSIKRALQKLVNDTGSNWDEFLGIVLFSLRAHVNMTTKMSPFRLLYGFEARFPHQVSEDYTLPNLEEHDEQFYKEYSINLKMRKDADIALALSNIAKAAEKNRRYAQRRRSKHGETTFAVGDCYVTEYEKENKKRKTAAT
uniref:Gypsy retrotransposon integrase-like protein 1 n=1 Tax=Gopherus agassizii TaxID=38772 RepID=A0A452GHI8_9SAUR